MIQNIINNSILAVCTKNPDLPLSGKRTFKINSLDELNNLINLDLFVLDGEALITFNESSIKDKITKSLKNMGLLVILLKDKNLNSENALNIKHLILRFRLFEFLDIQEKSEVGCYMLFRYIGPSYENQIHIYSLRHKIVDKIWFTMSKSKALTGAVRAVFQLAQKIKSRI